MENEEIQLTEFTEVQTKPDGKSVDVQEEDIFATEKHGDSSKRMTLVWRTIEIVSIISFVLLISFAIRSAIGSKYIHPT